VVNNNYQISPIIIIVTMLSDVSFYDNVPEAGTGKSGLSTPPLLFVSHCPSSDSPTDSSSPLRSVAHHWQVTLGNNRAAVSSLIFSEDYRR
jgi:hypothetical protein